MMSPDTVLNGNSVKIKLYNTPPLYFIILASSVKILDAKAIEFHRITVVRCILALHYEHRKRLNCLFNTVYDLVKKIDPSTPQPYPIGFLVLYEMHLEQGHHFYFFGLPA